jgi:CHAT domain
MVLAERWVSPVVLSVQVRPNCFSLTVAESTEWCGRASPVSMSVLSNAASEVGILTARLRRQQTSRDLHALALLDLVVPHPDTTALARAIRLLSSAIELPESVLAVDVDRAALLLQQYAATRRIGDLFLALDATAAAARRAPTSWHACWNHAVAMTWAGFRRTAPREWDRCARMPGHAGPWRRAEIRDAQPAAADTGVTTAVSARWREASREYAWGHLLPQWSAQVRVGDSQHARATLLLLDSVANALAPSGIDPSLLRLTNELRQLHDPPRAARLARTASAVRLYTWVRTADGRQAPALASARVDSADRLVAASSALHPWLILERALVAMQRGVVDSAAQLFTELRMQPLSLATVFGKSVAWGEASVLMARGRTAESLRAFGSIERACTIVALEDCVLGATAMGAQISTHIGDIEATEQLAGRTLAALARAPTSTRHWTANYLFRNIAELLALNDAVRDIDMESLGVAEELVRPDITSDILALRIRADIDAGAIDRAAAGVRKLRTIWMPQLTPDMQDFAAVNLLRFEAETLGKTSVWQRVKLFDSAAFLVMRDGNEIRRTPIRVARATARLAAGDTTAAVIELDTLLRAVRARAGGTATLFDAARLARITAAISVSLARVYRARGNALSALDVMTGTRRTLAASVVSSVSSTIVPIALRQVGDSVWVWTRGTGNWRLSSVALTERTLRAAINLDPEALAQVHDAVLRNQIVLPAGSTLCIDARGLLARVPWSALRDRQRNAYLIEQATIELVSDVAANCDGAVRSISRDRVAIVDAAPRHGSRALPAAVREVEMLVVKWGRHARRIDASLGGRATMGALRRMQIAHFAGHAVLNPLRAEKSYLSLPNSLDSAITSDQISRAEFSGVRLVILAACESSGGSTGVLGGFDSLAGAFLGAGVQSVIGATWPVDDAPTATLMQFLHAALRDGLSPAAALRSAQLEAIRSSDPRLNTPRVWSAFITMGS